MFAVKKAVTAFLLPPGFFVSLMVLVAGVSLLRRKIRMAVFCLTLAAVMWAASLPMVSGRLFRYLEAGFSMPESLSGDVVIVLCGGSDGSAPDLTGTGRLLPESGHRLLTAIRIQRRLGVPLIVSGGSGLSGTVPEARIAGRICMELGIPEKDLILEDRSRDTLENARFTADICRSRAFLNPVLVTSGHHLRRATACFRKFGVTVTPVPSSLHAENQAPGWWDFLPGKYDGLAMGIHEVLGELFYRYVHGVGAPD